MDHHVNTNRLPPGWDSKLDPKSGRSYYVNYITQNATLEDPRIKQLAQQLATMPTQDNLTSTRQGRHVPIMGASAKQSSININLQSAAIIESLNRIRSMFPTVPETHIKALLLKYHGREAVVVSALQVEKHPVATPGPFTPPPGRSSNTQQPLQARQAHSPLARRPQPKPHSPKMKLRYLKSVFPVVEETVLLDTLCNSDNNVTYATQRLIRMGFDKKDTPPPPRVSLKKQTQEERKAVELPKKSTPPPRMCSIEEKQAIKMRLCSKYPTLPERVVALALDSADFNESTAETILTLTSEDKQKTTPKGTPEEINTQIIQEEGEVSTEAVPIQIVALAESPKKRSKGKNGEKSNNLVTNSREEQEERENTGTVSGSPYLIKAQGPNKSLPKGPDNRLLLEDYIPWVGPQRGLAKGANRGLVLGTLGSKGPDPSLRKGPKTLVRGSIYSSLQISNESRCK